MRMHVIAAHRRATYLIAMCIIIAMYLIAMYIIAVHTKAMHTIAIALYIKCTYLIAVYIALRPNTPGQLKAYTRTAQRPICPPETISAQRSMVKDRYVRQKLYQLKVQWSKIAMSARNYITSKFKGQMSLCRLTHPCRVDLGTQYKKKCPYNTYMQMKNV